MSCIYGFPIEEIVDHFRLNAGKSVTLVGLALWVAKSGPSNRREATPWPLDATNLDQGWRVLLGVFPCSPTDRWHGKGGRGVGRCLVGSADPTKWGPCLVATSTCFLYTYLVIFVVFSRIQTLLQVQVELGHLSTKIQEMWCVLPWFWVKCWWPN
jgi:hypothetical protein